MATCFVIQPFDGGKYDKRFNDVYRPAIEAAGLQAYRVDQDPGVTIPIESVEKGIRDATICVADITTDNPNVWYELGFAFASRRRVVMLCSEERIGRKYPFDIQHRTVIAYSTESVSDFEVLRRKLTERLLALISSDEILDQIASADPVNPIQGLSHLEIAVLAAVAGGDSLAASGASLYSIQSDAERAGVTPMGFNLAIRKLTQKKLVQSIELEDSHGEGYPGLRLDNAGWAWVDANQKLFTLLSPNDEARSEGPF